MSEYEQGLCELVVDYQNYCSGRDLLPDDDLMYAVPCGETHELNFKYDLYYHSKSRGHQKHDYVGIYHDMSIRGIGKLQHTVHADLVNGELEGQGVNQLSREERERILGAMEDTPEMVGYSIEQDLEFLLVDELHETDFQEESKYGMRGPQYFNLREHLEVGETESLPRPEEIARQLEFAEWK